MDELTLDDKKYLSSKRAAQVTGYAKDYVGQLAREGRVEARLVGRNWYILESSILDHRFGEEEKKEPETKAEELPTTWEAPKYIPESPRTIAEIAPKPEIHIQKPAEANFEPPESRQVLEDMQSAWKEWFETHQKTEQEALPEASDMLLDDHEVRHFEIKPIKENPEAIAPVIEAEEEQIVHIERHSEAEAIVPVPIRDIAPQKVGSDSSNTYSPAISVKKLRRERRRVTRTSRNILRAVFLAFAILAVAVTLIGSGSLDSFGTSSGVTDFFSGTTKIKK